MPPRKAPAKAAPAAKAIPVRRATRVVEHEEMISKATVERDYVRKDAVAKIAKKYTDRHGWCDEVHNALAEVGVISESYTECAVTVKLLFKGRVGRFSSPGRGDEAGAVDNMKERFKNELSDWLENSEVNPLDYYLEGFLGEIAEIDLAVEKREATVSVE